MSRHVSIATIFSFLFLLARRTAPARRPDRSPSGTALGQAPPHSICSGAVLQPSRYLLGRVLSMRNHVHMSRFYWHVLFAAVCATALFGIKSAQSYCPSSPITFTLNATSWQPCLDIAGFDCRNVSNPRVYDPSFTGDKFSGSLQRLERRQVVGTPTQYVFLLSGGPGGSADILSRAVAPQVVSGLRENFAIHIPSIRGTRHTDQIEQWSTFPERFREEVDKSPFPALAFATTNMAIDVIISAKAAKAEFPNAELVMAGFSYGTYLAQRIMLLEPTLFSRAILDGSVAPVNRTNQFYDQSAALAPLSQLIAENCQRSEFCRKRSLPLADLIKFVDDVEAGKSTECFDAFVNSAAPGQSKAQVLHTILRQLALTSNTDVPNSLYGANASIPAIRDQFVEALLSTFAYNIYKQDHFYLDMRALTWALVNQFAQCPNFGRLFSFADAMKPIGSVLGTLGQLGSFVFGKDSPIGNVFTTQAIGLWSEGNLPLGRNSDLKAIQKAGVFRNPDSLNEADDKLVAGMQSLGAFNDCWANRAPTNVSTNVIFLNGFLDPNTNIEGNRLAYEALTTAPGFFKRNYTHTNAGHTVCSLGWSGCCPQLFRGFFGNDPNALVAYETCLLQDNAKTIDWEQAGLKKVSGNDIWAGLPPDNGAFGGIIFAIVFLCLGVVAGAFFLVRWLINRKKK